jgi:hypothetical protein
MEPLAFIGRIWMRLGSHLPRRFHSVTKPSLNIEVTCSRRMLEVRTHLVECLQKLHYAGVKTGSNDRHPMLDSLSEGGLIAVGARN